MIKYDKVDGGRSGAIDKLSKSQKVVKKSKNCQKSKKLNTWKICKGHWFGGTKLPDLRH